MGYAHMAQRGKGLHLRQYSRAFIVENEGKRVVFVSVDNSMMAYSVKREVSILLSAQHLTKIYNHQTLHRYWPGSNWNTVKFTQLTM